MLSNRRLKLLFLIALILSTLTGLPPFAARPALATGPLCTDEHCQSVCNPCFGVLFKCLNGHPICKCFCT
ncbi:MAG TPA: hypothetical protein VF173_32725 [Thermoanaerobaculia bacterium]|nr:hypothetical protein [Thermoanaerobaculia bacterium]